MSDAGGTTPARGTPVTSPDAPERAEGRRARRRRRGEGGVTVADLAARVGATVPAGGISRHAAEESSPRSGPLPIRPLPPMDRPADPDDVDAVTVRTAVADAATARLRYGSELPDLDRIHRTPARSSRRSDPPARVDDAESAEPTSVKPTRAARRRAKARQRAALLGRTAAALLAVLSLTLTGGAWQWSTSKNNRLNRIAALDPNSQDIIDPHGQFGDENFLIVGTDSRIGENAGVGAGTVDDAEGARSDTIMLVNIPANRKRVVVVSFPRDLAITPLSCQSWNAETGEYGPIYDEESGTYGPNYVYTETKLNSTYAYGGPKCLVKQIQKLSGLAINRFMAVDFVGFDKMVDALGGVEVCTTRPIYDEELGTVLAHTGRQVINGPTALNYVRARSVTTEINGDYGRIKRQQLFLSSLLRSVISTETLLSPTKLNNVVNMFINDSYVDNIKTKDLVSLGQSLRGVTAGHITFVTVPTGETDENGDEPPRTEDMRALFDAIIDDDPLPGEPGSKSSSSGSSSSSASSSASSGASTDSSDSTDSGSQTGTASDPGTDARQIRAVTTAPSEVSVRVSNGTDESGLAAATADQLELKGFGIISTDDYDGSLTSTTVLFARGDEQAAATVASALGNPPILRVNDTGGVVRVILGPDFHSVRTPAPSGSPVNVRLMRSVTTERSVLPDDLTITNAGDTTCE